MSGSQWPRQQVRTRWDQIPRGSATCTAAQRSPAAPQAQARTPVPTCPVLVPTPSVLQGKPGTSPQAPLLPNSGPRPPGDSSEEPGKWRIPQVLPKPKRRWMSPQWSTSSSSPVSIIPAGNSKLGKQRETYKSSLHTCIHPCSGKHI